MIRKKGKKGVSIRDLEEPTVVEPLPLSAPTPEVEEMEKAEVDDPWRFSSKKDKKKKAAALIPNVEEEPAKVDTWGFASQGVVEVEKEKSDDEWGVPTKKDKKKKKEGPGTVFYNWGLAVPEVVEEKKVEDDDAWGFGFSSTKKSKKDKKKKGKMEEEAIEEDLVPYSRMATEAPL